MASRIVLLAWFAALLILTFAPTLKDLVFEWIDNEDMGHGFFVPLVSGYIIWLLRDQLKFPAKPCFAGLLLVLYAGFQYFAAVLGVELFLARTAFVFCLTGMALYLAGWENFKILRFPLFLLLFMVPLPAIIFSQITFPLQIFASQVAEVTLGLLGIPVLREGNILELPSQRLSVVEACSGIRSLISLSFLSLVYGYFFDQRPWMKWALWALIIPIAVIANAARVTTTGILSEMNPELAKGFFHTAEGWIIFAVAMVMLIGVHALLSLIIRRFSRPPAAS